ncbi:MAG: ABC transporter substrate-binding protein [Eubacteriales bacterium]|nr:ABC transporter substrate-binding protein [Eubacteriales bacterium]
MKKLLSALLTLALLCALFTTPVFAETADTITITDHAGNEVTLPKEINRIVTTSIYPFASVVTMYLGSAEKLVGIHPVSYSAAVNSTLGKLSPEIANASTGFMTGSDLNIEELIKLKPDVVFYNAGNTQEKELCDQAGIPAVAISATKWDYDVIKTYDEWIALLSQTFPEQDKAQVVSDYSKEIYDMIQERVASLDDSERTRALFLFQYSDSAMITSGRHFFGQYWASAAGGINVAQDLEADNSNATISMEQVYEWNPDVIYITNFTPTQPEDIYNNAIGGDDWSTVKAVQDGRVHKLPLGSYRTYTPGTDTPMTLLWMAKTMYPDLFADIDLEQQVKDYYQEIYGVELSDEDVAAMFTPSSAAAEGFKK